jgi:hypothetical protein
MADHKLSPRPVLHECPVCHHPQTKIKRKLSDDKHGATNYVCSRAECAIGINLSQVDTWEPV